MLRGLRNGIYYGGKVRLIHSLVMMLLFKSITKAELKNIIKLGAEHARNLGSFVLLYKTSCFLLEKLWGETSLNSFLSGFVIGGFIFGRKTPVHISHNVRSMSRSFSTC